MTSVSPNLCPRCGARADGPCKNCAGVEYDLDQAHDLMHRALMAAIYGEHQNDPWSVIWHDIETFLRVAASERGKP